MRILAGLLGALILAIQVPLWMGKGGWLRVWETDRQLAAQQQKNARLETRNAALAALIFAFTATISVPPSWSVSSLKTFSTPSCF